MYGGLVKFVVKPGMRSEFLEFLRWDAKVAKDTEPGTLRFDVWTSPEPDVVYVYETYIDEEAFEAHKNHEPFKKFDEILQHEMLEEWGEAIPFAESITSNIDELPRGACPQYPRHLVQRAGCRTTSTGSTS